MTVHHTIGRHRRRHQTWTAQTWAVAAAMLAAALTFVFVPHIPKRPRPPLAPPPPTSPRPTLPLPSEPQGPRPQQQRQAPVEEPDPDEAWGALVRPYMPPPPARRPLVPRPRRAFEGDLLAAAPQREPDDLADLAAVVRTYLRTVG
ncbi:hypothetical protein [Nocardiopsis sp. LOL_012]|uniref:hypothetical protein n=1 Tax=Nocardiopsis sp. LOL_012 TaxID=3345409 RepID=UPI003A874388